MDTIVSRIEVTRGVAGGKRRIAGHRITVQNIVNWHDRLCVNADEIVDEYGRSPADTHAALAHYYDYREEIDRTIRGDGEFIYEQRPLKTSRSRLQWAGARSKSEGGAEMNGTDDRMLVENSGNVFADLEEADRQGAVKREARRRVEAGVFFGYVAYASLTACKCGDGVEVQP